VCTSAADSSSPTTPLTTDPSWLGTEMSELGDRRINPFTEKLPNVVPNAAAACATVPSAWT